MKPAAFVGATRRTLLVIATIAASLLLSPVAQPGWTADAPALVWALGGDPSSLDYPATYNGEAGPVVTQIFNTLVRMKAGGTALEPDLATAWSVSPDGRTWTFTLRQGVVFQDGTPWNAEAAKFNIDRWADPHNPYHGQGVDFAYWNDFMSKSIDEVRAPGPYTLQFVLKTPLGPLLSNLAIPAFDFASPASLKQFGADGAGTHPVGTGPYSFVDWARADHITLQANPRYFRTGLPKVPRVVYRIIKDNSARYLALKAGEIQVMELPDAESVQSAEADPSLRVGPRPAFGTGWLQFDLRDPLLRDRRVREAMARAINKTAIVRALYGKYGQVADQIMPPVMWGRSTNVPAYSYSPDTARKLLADAGYPNGVALDFWYLPVSRPYFPDGKAIATAIANDFGKVGIRAHLVTEDWAAYRKDRLTKLPLWMYGWIGDTGDPDDWFSFYFSGHEADSAIHSYDNATVFALIARARTQSNPADRARLYAQAQNLIARDLPLIPIAHAGIPILMNRKVEGLVPQPDGNERLETVSIR